MTARRLGDPVAVAGAVCVAGNQPIEDPLLGRRLLDLVGGPAVARALVDVAVA